MSKKVIDLLNAARSREITAITQYMAQHYELEDKDFGKLAKKMKEIATPVPRFRITFISRKQVVQAWRNSPSSLT